MFDRSSRAQGAFFVEVTLADGRQLKGKLVVQQGRTLPEVLNGPTNFIELEIAAMQRTFVAKPRIQTVTLLDHATERTCDLERPEKIVAPLSTTGTDATSTAQ